MAEGAGGGPGPHTQGGGHLTGSGKAITSSLMPDFKNVRTEETLPKRGGGDISVRQDLLTTFHAPLRTFRGRQLPGGGEHSHRQFELGSGPEIANEDGGSMAFR